MSSEKITFYSGPMHGQSRPLPSNIGNEYPIKEAMVVEGVSGLRDGKYTRVHDNSGRGTSDFEWSGYTSPFMPQRIES